MGGHGLITMGLEHLVKALQAGSVPLAHLDGPAGISRGHWSVSGELDLET